MEKWNLPRSPISERSDELFDTLVSSFGATRTSDFFLVRRRAIFEKRERARREAGKKKSQTSVTESINTKNSPYTYVCVVLNEGEKTPSTDPLSFWTFFEKNPNLGRWYSALVCTELSARMYTIF